MDNQRFEILRFEKTMKKRKGTYRFVTLVRTSNRVVVLMKWFVFVRISYTLLVG